MRNIIKNINIKEDFKEYLRSIIYIIIYLRVDFNREFKGLKDLYKIIKEI